MSSSPTLFSGAAAGTHCEYLSQLCTTKGNGRNALFGLDIAHEQKSSWKPSFHFSW